MRARGFAHITAQALVPEQIVSYVTAVGESRPVLCGGCVAYDFAGQRTLIAYAPGSPPDEDPVAAAATMNRAVTAALADKSCSMLTVLGPAKPEAAPADAASREDAYAFLALPLAPPGQNLRNMLRRGERECVVAREIWSEEHGALMQGYLGSRPLEAGTRRILARIPEYLAATPDAVVFTARSRHGSRLLACAIGDFSSLTTAFYMFAFRSPACPPGVSDVLLRAIIERAEQSGHQFVNLGLGINKGIAAFKRKWGQAVLLPCARTSWNAQARSTANASAPVPREDSLSVYAPPRFVDNLRRFLPGGKRRFDCLQIEVTSQCPGKCTYCPHTAKRAVWLSRRMEDTTFAALAPLVRQAKRVHLQGWGEPLAHPRFFDYAAAALRVGCAVSTTTCGLGVTDAVAARLAASGIDIVAFSLAGVDEESNAARAGVPFAKVREAILAMNRAKQNRNSECPHIHLAYLLLASRAGRAAELPALMADLDVPAAVVSTLDYLASPGMEKEAYAPEETGKIEHARRILHDAAAEAAAMGRTIHYSLPGTRGRGECNEQIRSCMYIDAKGVIAPCIYLNLPTTEDDPRRRVFGSVHEKKPMDIWNDTDYALFRTRLSSGDPGPPCRACPKRFERVF